MPRFTDVGRRTRRGLRLIVVLAGGLLLSASLGACGDDEGGTSAPGAAAKTSAVGDVIKFGTDPTYPPLEFKEDGKITGAEVEIMELVAADLGAKPSWSTGDFASLLPSLKSQRFDVMAAGMYDRPQRRNEIVFVDFLTNAGRGVLFPADKVPPDDDPKHLCDLTIAAGKGTGVADGDDPKLPALTKDVCPEPVKSLILPNEPAAQLAVQSGRADAFMTSYMSVGNIAKTAGGGTLFKAVQYPSDDDAPIAVGVRPGEAELAEQIRASIQKLMDSGKYTEILKKYGIEGMALKKATINEGQGA